MATQKSITLKSAIDGHLRYVASAYSPATHTDYKHTHTKFLDFIGDPNAPFDAITPAHIEDFMIHMRETPIAPAGVTADRTVSQPRYRRPKTILNLHIGLSALWAWGLKRGYVDENIVRLVPKPKCPSEPIVPLDEADIVKLFRACEFSRAWHNNPLTTNRRPSVARDKAIVAVLVETAIRASELCNLTIADVVFYNGGGSVSVDLGKGNKSRVVPFSRRCAKMLLNYLDTRPYTAPDDPFFVNIGRNDGLPMTRGNVEKLIRRLGKKAGVDVSPHKLRTTAACLLVRNGCDGWRLKELMGHADITTTMRYVQAATLDLDAAMRKASPLDNLRL